MPHAKHIKVMVDYDLVDPDILAALSRIKALDVKTIVECGFAPNEKDEELVKGTSQRNRILLTADKQTIHHRKYRPCTHGGIIVVKESRPTARSVFRSVKRFMLSGHRKWAKGHVTYLQERTMSILTHKETISVKHDGNTRKRHN